MDKLCTWCGTEHEAGVEGFCSEDCRRNFHSACQLWGEAAYGAGEASIWQLQELQGRLERQAHFTQKFLEDDQHAQPDQAL